MNTRYAFNLFEIDNVPCAKDLLTEISNLHNNTFRADAIDRVVHDKRLMMRVFSMLRTFGWKNASERMKHELLTETAIAVKSAMRMYPGLSTTESNNRSEHISTCMQTFCHLRGLSFDDTAFGAAVSHMTYLAREISNILIGDGCGRVYCLPQAGDCVLLKCSGISSPVFAYLNERGCYLGYESRSLYNAHGRPAFGDADYLELQSVHQIDCESLFMEAMTALIAVTEKNFSVLLGK